MVKIVDIGNSAESLSSKVLTGGDFITTLINNVQEVLFGQDLLMYLGIGLFGLSLYLLIKNRHKL